MTSNREPSLKVAHKIQTQIVTRVTCYKKRVSVRISTNFFKTHTNSQMKTFFIEYKFLKTYA